MKAYAYYPVILLSILMTGFFALSAAAEELDATFGLDGRVATSIGNYEDNAYAVALQQDGKILAGGSSSNGADLDFALVRYNRDGSLDRTFNIDGAATTQVGWADDEIAAVAVQDDGYILAAGYSVQDGYRDLALVRYAPDGQRDPSFGLDGIVVTEYGMLDDEITAMTIDDEGRIVVAGYSTGTTGRAVIIGRYLASGEPDFSFGDDGVSLTGVGEDAVARGIDMDSEGRILITGSCFHAGQTEVMVLRFTDAGKLDTSFGVEGLGLTGYIQDSTEGYGIKVHESGSILVAGSVGDPGYLDAAVFLFGKDGQPDTGFGENGMLEIEASLEDDMALAVDLKDDVIFLSGFAEADGIRQFLFISLQVSLPETSVQEEDEVAVSGAGVPFVLKTGAATTSLNIGERRVEDSYAGYFADDESGMRPLMTTVNQTAFGTFSNDISYAVAVQPDGKAIAAGASEDNGVVSFAVARFAGEASVSSASAAAAATPTSWLVTKDPFEVTRTGAISGGIITAGDASISKRGVVFSIAPDPVLKSGGSDTGNDDGSDSNGGSGTDTTAPAISSASATLAGGATEATLSATTNENATCRYATTSGDTFTQMTIFSSTGATSHSTSVANAAVDDPLFIRCQDGSGNTSAETQVTVTSVAFRAPNIHNGLFAVERVAAGIGGLMIGTAHAQTTTDNSNTSDTTSRSVFSLSSDFIEEGSTEDGSGTGSYSSILRNLKPGTFYYLRAYAVTSGGSIHYGNQVGFRTADSCFIATAAYGSIMHSSVKLLRVFRDRYLLTNAPGRMFVRIYYRYSPPIADMIAADPALRAVVKIMLLPFVGISWLFVNLGMVSGILVVATLFILPYVLYRQAWQRA